MKLFLLKIPKGRARGSKILIFDRNLIFWTKCEFLDEIWIFDQVIILDKIFKKLGKTWSLQIKNTNLANLLNCQKILKLSTFLLKIPKGRVLFCFSVAKNELFLVFGQKEAIAQKRKNNGWNYLEKQVFWHYSDQTSVQNLTT